MVLMHILFATFFNLFVFHLQVDVVGPLLLNASLLLILMTDYSDWLAQVTDTKLIDNFLTIVWLYYALYKSTFTLLYFTLLNRPNIELTD